MIFGIDDNPVTALIFQSFWWKYDLQKTKEKKKDIF